MSLLEMQSLGGTAGRSRCPAASLAVLLVLACALLAPPAGANIASGSGYSLRLDVQPAPLIAGKRVETLPQAVHAFGRPRAISSVTDRPACAAVWPTLGLQITFSTTRPGLCRSRNPGPWLEVTALTPRWHTSNGLHIGDDAARLHALYPQSTRLDFVAPGTWKLETGGPLCDGGAPLALAAQIHAGVVRSLTILHIPACG